MCFREIAKIAAHWVENRERNVPCEIKLAKHMQHKVVLSAAAHRERLTSFGNARVNDVSCA